MLLRAAVIVAATLSLGGCAVVSLAAYGLKEAGNGNQTQTASQQDQGAPPPSAASAAAPRAMSAAAEPRSMSASAEPPLSDQPIIPSAPVDSGAVRAQPLN